MLGLGGAFIATVAIFTPSVLLMLVSSQALVHLKSSRGVQAALKGIRAAVAGMIFSAAYIILQTIEVHWVSLIILAFSLLALFKLKLDVAWMIPLAGGLGMLLY